MERSILIGGSGGQGILLLGRAAATVAMLEGRYVTWFPSYGAEMRGGTANCTVIVSDDPIGSPVVREVDILVVMNHPSLKRFLHRLKTDGHLFYDSSLIKNPELENPSFSVHPVRASEIASEIGSVKYANMVLLGALLRTTGIGSIESLHEALKIVLPERHHNRLPENLKAIQMGYNGQGG